MTAAYTEAACALDSQGLPPAATLASKAPRVAWSDRETMVLIDLWEEHFDDLRRQKRNGAVYLEIARRLRASGYIKNKKQVHSKIENMTQMYRKWTKQGVTESSLPSWPFYWAIHRFMQKVKPKVITNRTLQSPMPVQHEQQVQKKINEEAVLSKPTETQQLLADTQSAPADLHCQPGIRLKEEPPDDASGGMRNRTASDASSESVSWPAQQESNIEISTHLRHGQEHGLPLASQLSETTSLGTDDILQKILDEQRQLRLSIDESNRRKHELLLRQTRLQERATEALVQIAAAITSCIKAPSFSPYIALCSVAPFLTFI
ncbi:myb/SANT-like DNA-binding domain-containing protein 1 isoform X2 [Dermacentor silvarum]|uniref:myb/SANT-like DNA-binding domain-containing protein 1 isoform X2 n=1 Tax=Dermacentor silvarum TaxID=543639 RepID=UPI002100694D|nr:myb/SANT-like DNA-binding domain-containing protein 1 isoform X2 [Dermacentor silvarum]